jgi:hypothetical protein
MNLHYWDYDYIYKIMKKKKCYVCDEIIEGKNITITPANDTVCCEACLFIYRKMKNGNNE